MSILNSLFLSKKYKNIISGGTDAAHAFYMRSSNNKITAGHNSTWNRVGYTLPSGNMLDKWNFGAVSFSNSSDGNFTIMDP